MPMHVRISETALLPELMTLFLRNECVAHPVARDSLLIVHVNANHGDEARLEVAFFLRAWQLHNPGVAAVVSL